ncbi:MAG: DUF3365 domain-containing protein [Proteobacteria bacterium]|nr:DUF3365 domain-containing protein [Desulfobulbaceae bacterium]MBU4153894.1 DUF3365 domain-containing protein [Pseudomonadota bacterium]
MSMTIISNRFSPLITFALVVGFVWTLLLGGIFFWNQKMEHEQTLLVATTQTRALFQKFLLTRHWNASHGGVYVPMTKDTIPNPYLVVKNRDVVTTDGLRLTMLNPAYMTRQISGIATEQKEFFFHLTSIAPINPANSPSSWEEMALHHFNNGATEYYELQEEAQGKKVFRYMAPLVIQEPCLDCHAAYGDKINDMHGGISVAIDATPLVESRNKEIRHAGLALFAIWLFGISSLNFGVRRLHLLDRERNKVVADLRESLTEVKLLSGLLPICCKCKKIRDDQGYWNQVERYFEARTQAKFSHGICPDCARDLYPDIYEELERRKALNSTQKN